MIITRIIQKISQARRNMPTCAYYREPTLRQGNFASVSERGYLFCFNATTWPLIQLNGSREGGKYLQCTLISWRLVLLRWKET